MGLHGVSFKDLGLVYASFYDFTFLHVISCSCVPRIMFEIFERNVALMCSAFDTHRAYVRSTVIYAGKCIGPVARWRPPLRHSLCRFVEHVT